MLRTDLSEIDLSGGLFPAARICCPAPRLKENGHSWRSTSPLPV
jgi:hypothetical protein